MHFTKMQGIGNDYVYVDCTKETVENPGKVSKFVSNRHFGIGSDGLILIKPSEIADFEMDMYNADGSRGKMCGNGIRCVGKYVYDHGLTDKTRLTIATGSGLKTLDLTIADGKVRSVRVDMGSPVLQPADIPVLLPGDRILNEPFSAGGREYRITCVSMGNPHCVTFLDEDVHDFPLNEVGPLFENAVIFPDRVNAEFATVISRNSFYLRVYERGSGETFACGTGACAAAVAAILLKKTENPVTVHLPGGNLFIDWDQKNNRVYMTGPAQEVFEGDITINV